jgi:single-strand DNA-binding protein
MGVNKTIHVGNCAEPEIISTEHGTIAKFGLAINESYTNKQGEKVENTDWFNVVCYRKLAEIVEKYVKKGQSLYVEGKLKTRSWDDKEGNKRYTTEIVADNLQMLGRKSDSNDQQKDNTPPYVPEANGGDDQSDLPF